MPRHRLVSALVLPLLLSCAGRAAAQDETTGPERYGLRLEYRDVDLTPALKPEAFQFTCPEGTTLEELPCLAP